MTKKITTTPEHSAAHSDTVLNFAGQRPLGKQKYRRNDDQFLYDLREKVIHSPTIQESLEHVLKTLQTREYTAPRIYRQKENNLYALVAEIGLPEEAKQKVAHFDVSAHLLLERILNGDSIYNNTHATSEPSLFLGSSDPLYYISEEGLLGIPYTRTSEIYPYEIRGAIFLNYNPNKKTITDRELSLLEQISWIVADKVTHLLELQEYQKINQKLELQIKLDGPTGLFNKKTFHENLETYLKEFKRQGTPYHLVMMDIDHFKDLNDNFGHYQGDLFISHFGNYLCNLPTASYSTGYRIGGDEFALVIPLKTSSEVLALAKSIREHIKTIPRPPQSNPLSLSIGIQPALHSFTDGETWYRRADTKCYAAKRNGRDCINF